VELAQQQLPQVAAVARVCRAAIYALRRRWRDGTSATVFEPLDFLARLSALVPRQRAHLLTYHGVLAQNPQAPLGRSTAPRFRRRRPDLPPLRRCAQADRDDHRAARRAQDPRTTSSCPAPRRRSPPPERLPSPSSPGSPRRGRAAHLQRGAVWRRRAPGRKPSASGRLDAAPEALQNSTTCVRGTGSTRPWARDLRRIGPNRPEPLPAVGGHPLGVPLPRPGAPNSEHTGEIYSPPYLFNGTVP